VLVSQQRVHAQVSVPTDARVVLVRSLLVFRELFNSLKALAHGREACLLWTDGELLDQVDSQWPEISKLPKESPGARSQSDSMCYIIFTSGSTGRPKGAVMQHNGVINNLGSLAACAPGSPPVPLQPSQHGFGEAVCMGSC